MTILILIVAVGVIVVMMKKMLKKKESDNKANIEKTIPSIVHYSDEFNHEETIEINNYFNSATTILIYEENPDIWICPSCETENPLSKQSCCICHYIQ